MKLVLSLLLLLSSLVFAENFSIKSWNVKKLSMNTLGKKQNPDFKNYINEEYDIVTLQELLDKDVMSKLSNRRYFVSKKLGKKYFEYVGFIVSDKYKNSDIKLIQYYDKKNSYYRDPVMLSIDNKIGVVSVHLLYGRKASRNATGKYDELTKREVRALSNMVKYFSKKSGIPESKIVIAGDFNLKPKKLKKIIPNKNILITKKTTVTRSKNKIALNSYDHFIVDKGVESHSSYVDYSVLDKYFEGRGVESRKKMFKKFSDHYPIILKIDL